MLGQEVGHADRPHATGGVDLLQDRPDVNEQSLGRHRPMDQVQVDHLNTERPAAGFEGLRAGAMLPVAQFGRDEDFLARDSGGGYRGTNTRFVAIGGGRVDVPIAGFQCVLHHSLRLVLRDLEYAKAELRNGDPVVQLQVRNNNHANSICVAEKIPLSLGIAVDSVTPGPWPTRYNGRTQVGRRMAMRRDAPEDVSARTVTWSSSWAATESHPPPRAKCRGQAPVWICASGMGRWFARLNTVIRLWPRWETYNRSPTTSRCAGRFAPDGSLSHAGRWFTITAERPGLSATVISSPLSSPST